MKNDKGEDVKDLFIAKKIIAEAVSSVYREYGFDKLCTDNFRNWIIACNFVEELLQCKQEIAKSM